MAQTLLSDVVQSAPIRALREMKTAREAIKLLVAHGWLMPMGEGADVRGTKRKEAYWVVKVD